MNRPNLERHPSGLDVFDPEPEYCGVYWIITTCLTAIAIGIWLGMVLWLILGEHK